MEEFGAALGRTPLFQGIGPDELTELLSCLEAREAFVPRGATALRIGDAPDHIGIVLEGELRIAREDADGQRAILAALWPGDYYGEALACAGVAHSPVSVEAVAPSRVLRLPYENLVRPCRGACASHRVLATNLASIIAKKNLVLQRRMEILERKSIRERVMLYLTGQMPGIGRPFVVAMNRGEMAAYLAVDRSALSRELGRLREDGILSFEGSRFVVNAEHPAV